MLISGKNSVFEALESDKTINKIYAIDTKDAFAIKIFRKAKEKSIRVDVCDKKRLDTLMGTTKHQGFVADIVDFNYSELEDIINERKGKDAFILILDGIEDPHNLGAIIRSAECAGVDGIVLPKHRACAINDTVMRVSAGALNNVKVAKVTNLNQTIETLKQHDIWVYAVETDGEEITKTNLKGNVALVVGGEGTGVSAQVKKNCDGVVKFEMFGKINSLNASVAAGIALFEVLRQRKN